MPGTMPPDNRGSSHLSCEEGSKGVAGILLASGELGRDSGSSWTTGRRGCCWSTALDLRERERDSSTRSVSAPSHRLSPPDLSRTKWIVCPCLRPYLETRSSSLRTRPE